jgi:hypothetical protein
MTVDFNPTERGFKMNIMNIPGFTAEASLYKAIDHYKLADTHASENQQKIIPQLMPLECTGCTCSPDGCKCEKCVLT